MKVRQIAFAIFYALLSAYAHAAERFVPTGSVDSAEAHQAAAADERFVYAVASEKVAKIDRSTGRQVAISTGRAKHLNSGFLWQGKLYCAHSNYPQKPEKSEIMVMDPETMELSTFKNFGEYRGSLTWAVKEGAFWWCTFARYGAENAGTNLVKFDSEWRELGAWTYPPEVVREMGKYSISGGVWWNGDLLVTGHDHRTLYRVRLPADGAVLEYVASLPSPFPGQGIAIDPLSKGLVGIDRAKRKVIFAQPES